MNRRTLAITLLTFVLASGVAHASWYDDYEDGIAAARKGNWSSVLQKMSAAIKANGSENNRARAYGNIFYNYHPYYYRGVANLNLGNYQQAIADLEKTSGPGELDLGGIAQHLERAKRQLAAANEPAPEPVRPAAPPVQAPAVAIPAAPQIDPALRQRAVAAISAAKQKVQSAQQRRATNSQQFTQAMSMLTDATTKNATAKSNDDLSAIIAMADNAGILADLAMPPSAPAPAPAPVQVAQTTAPAAIIPKPAAATSTVMDDYTSDVRHALENYFAGEFDVATREFEKLSRKMPDNAWVWAFLGASQYSQYAFEADAEYRAAALRSFQRAKQLRSWNGGLPQKYFSRRIRKAFDEQG